MISITEEAYTSLHESLRTMRETCDAAIASGHVLEQARAIHEVFATLDEIVESLPSLIDAQRSECLPSPGADGS